MTLILPWHLLLLRIDEVFRMETRVGVHIHDRVESGMERIVVVFFGYLIQIAND